MATNDLPTQDSIARLRKDAIGKDTQGRKHYWAAAATDRRVIVYDAADEKPEYVIDLAAESPATNPREWLDYVAETVGLRHDWLVNDVAEAQR